MFKGSIVALVTPMQNDGCIDKSSLHDLIEWHINEKTAALVVAGTTGESPTLDATEKNDLFSLVVKQVAKRIPIIAGTGTNCTRTTIQRTQEAYEAGVDACLVVTPYYNKPTQNGLYQHFKAIADSVPLPIILYNVPSRTACDLSADTIENLAKISNIIGIKEASGKIERVHAIKNRCGKAFLIFSGDDATALDCMLNGGDGVISVTANVAPNKMRRLCDAALSGNKALAEKINTELMGLHTTLFLESNPIPTKWVLHKMGLIPSGIRLPLMTLDVKYHAELCQALDQASIIP
jgi:4-hydroxy-tetrahydrodipicolinate synthase